MNDFEIIKNIFIITKFTEEMEYRKNKIISSIHSINKLC